MSYQTYDQSFCGQMCLRFLQMVDAREFKKFDLHARFCKGYYGYEYLELSLIFTFLCNGPLIIIDCSRQNESVKSGTVDARLDFECKENVPANTTAYCLIIHNCVVQYNLTNVVRKIT